MTVVEPRVDRTALSYWFPIVKAAGLPVPETVIVDMPKAAREFYYAAFDGDVSITGDCDPRPFVDAIREAVKRVGSPAFLRTDHTSGKHSWARTCFVPPDADIARRIWEIIEYSEMADFMGIPWERWAVREFLPTIPLGVCRDYADMPICREFRFFVDGPEVVCWHPYWPAEALDQGGAVFNEEGGFDELCRCDDLSILTDIASRAGQAVGGAWSVDLLETERGWFLTDMAEAGKSFHWPGCAHASGGAVRP